MVHSSGVYLNYKQSCFQLFPTILGEGEAWQEEAEIS